MPVVMDMKKDIEIITRYILALLPFVFFNQIFLFLKWITFSTLSLIFGLFTNVATNFEQGLIVINGQTISLIEPCIAVSAFILLFLLNIVTLDIKIKNRVLAFLLSFGILFLFNIIRIIFLYSILNFNFFNTIHLVVWYGLSTIVVVLDWFLMCRIFKIKTIPVISDIMYLIYSLKHDIRKERARERKFREEMNY